MLSHIRKKLRLSYTNSAQEKEYLSIKTPLYMSFSASFFVGITVLFILLALKSYTAGLKIVSYLAVGPVTLGILFLIFRKKLQKYLHFITLIYILILMTGSLIVFNNYFPVLRPPDVFYTGYALGLLMKLVDFRVNNFYIALALHAVFIITRHFVVTPSVEEGILLVLLEIIPIILSFRAELADRMIFDKSYKSKNMLIKFKQLLTEYLPNPISVLSSDYSQMLFVNKSFKKLFGDQDIKHIKQDIDNLVYDVQMNHENKELQKLIRSNYRGEDIKQIKFANLMQLLQQNKGTFKNTISFQLKEQKPLKDEGEYLQDNDSPLQKRTRMQSTIPSSPHYLQVPLILYSKEGENSIREKSEIEYTENQHIPFISPKNRSGSRLDEATRRAAEPQESTSRIFKVKMFPLTCWDDKETVTIVLDDVTYERTIMELKLADKNKDLVIAMVSHELRTPINGMLGLLEMMKKEAVKPEVLAYLSACQTNSRLLLNLVNSILDFSQIKHNKLKLTYARVTLKDLLTEVKSLFDHFCQMKGLYLETDIDSDVPEVLITDKTRLSQIIINIVGNAFKFTFKGGVTIKASLTQDDPHRIKFSIVDTGIGIKKEDQQKLFTVFGKLEQEDKKINTHGVGLGLTISNDLVIMLDSYEKKGIQVESEVGKGTTFSFCIQLETKEILGENSAENSDDDESWLEDLEEMSASITVIDKVATHSEVITKKSMFGSHADSPHHLILQYGSSRNDTQYRHSQFATPKNCSIHEGYTLADAFSRKEMQDGPWCLVVDDNPFNLMIATSNLKEKGYQIKTALTGQEAIEVVKGHDNSNGFFKVILMDCHMPVMDGYEASRILTQMMETGEVERFPIIALTANNQDEEQDKRCKDAGMIACMSKPLNVKELETLLQNLEKESV